MDLSKLEVLNPKDGGEWFQNVPYWDLFKLRITAAGELTVIAPCGAETVHVLPAGLVLAVPVFALPEKSYVENLRTKTVTPFVGCTTLVCVAGTTGTADFYNTTDYNLAAAASHTNFAPATGALNNAGCDTDDATLFELELTATVDNLDQLTAGEVWVWVKRSILP